MLKRRESRGASGTSGREGRRDCLRGGTGFRRVDQWRAEFGGAHFCWRGRWLHLTFDLRGAALLVRLDPVIVGGAVATVAPQQGIDEGLTDKLALAIG